MQQARAARMRELQPVRVQQAAVRPKSRRPTRPGRAAKERRLTSKKHRADVKGARGRRGGHEE